MPKDHSGKLIDRPEPTGEDSGSWGSPSSVTSDGSLAQSRLPPVESGCSNQMHKIGKRASYNARVVVSVVLSVVTAISAANYFCDLGLLGHSPGGITLGIGFVGFLYAMFVTPKKAEFREHGWWWREGNGT
jgi:hypothetical protein